jgi:hypothetical protein
MSTDLIDSLLADIPVEEVVDERVGVHDDAVLAEPVTITSNEYDGKLLYSLVAKFSFTVGEKTVKAQSNISLPDSESPTWVKQVLLAWLHAFQLVPLTSKKSPVLPSNVDEEIRLEFAQKIAAAVNVRVGETVGITMYEQTKGKNAGFVAVRPNRPRKIVQGE